jgi:hypothetical protein
VTRQFHESSKDFGLATVQRSHLQCIDGELWFDIEPLAHLPPVLAIVGGGGPQRQQFEPQAHVRFDAGHAGKRCRRFRRRLGLGGLH